MTEAMLQPQQFVSAITLRKDDQRQDPMILKAHDQPVDMTAFCGIVSEAISVFSTSESLAEIERAITTLSQANSMVEQECARRRERRHNMLSMGLRLAFPLLPAEDGKQKKSTCAIPRPC